MANFSHLLLLVFLYETLEESTSRYYLSPNILSYTNANRYCQNYCSNDLVSIHNDTQFDRITSITQNAFNNSPPLFDPTPYNNYDIFYWDVWIGLFRPSSPGGKWDLSWTDGSPFDYGTNSSRNQVNGYPWVDVGDPNDSNGVEDCVHIWTHKGFTWNDENCVHQMTFMCNSCNGKFNKYILIKQNMSWFDAQQFCQTNLGTDLASIHSEDDNFEAHSLCNATGLARDCWIGYNDLNEQGVWSWIDGTSIDYAGNTTGGVYPWGDLEPNNYQDNGGEHCAEYDWDKSYEWNDDNCTYDAWFICNLPSETCYNSQWNYQGDITWDNCEINSEVSSHSIINNKQWIYEGDNVFVIDYVFNIKNVNGGYGESGLLIYHFGTVCDYYYIGVAVDAGNGGIFIKKYFNDVTDYLFNNSAAFVYSFGTYYILRVKLTYTTRIQFDVSIQGEFPINGQTISHTDITSNAYVESFKYVGLKNWNANVTGKSLYVSETARYNTSYDLSWSECTTTDPTYDPTSDPTSDPTVDPTIDPTSDPTSDPTTDPTSDPTTDPTSDPTSDPTTDPTVDPTTDPTIDPTADPTAIPTEIPSFSPTTPSPTFPGDLICGSHINGTYNDQPITFKVQMNVFEGDMTFDASDSEIILVRIEAKNASDTLLKSWIYEGNNQPILTITDLEMGEDIFFTIIGSAQLTGIFDIKILCTSAEPTTEPTIEPTFVPTLQPTIDPTTNPTKYPTKYPSATPTNLPTTVSPTTNSPTTALPTMTETNNNYTITINTDDLTKEEIENVIKDIFNVSNTDITTEVNNDGSITFLISTSSPIYLETDIVKEKIVEGIANEYGEDVEVEIEVTKGNENKKGDTSDKNDGFFSNDLVLYLVIAIAVLLIIICILLIVNCCRRSGKQNKENNEETQMLPTTTSPGSLVTSPETTTQIEMVTAGTYKNEGNQSGMIKNAHHHKVDSMGILDAGELPESDDEQNGMDKLEVTPKILIDPRDSIGDTSPLPMDDEDDEDGDMYTIPNKVTMGGDDSDNNENSTESDDPDIMYHKGSTKTPNGPKNNNLYAIPKGTPGMDPNVSTHL